MELINSKISSDICRGDAKAVCTNVDDFVKANEYQYYVLINTWSYMMHDLGCDENIFLVTVERNGLLYCIDKMSTAGTSILANYPAYPALDLWISDLIGNLSVQDAVQVLRFGKRFTLIEADTLERNSILSFLDTNNINKMKDRNGFPRWLTRKMAGYIESALAGIDLNDLYTSGYFSPGAVHNCKKSEFDKIKSWSLPNFGSIEYPTVASSTDLLTPASSWGATYPIWDDHYHDHVVCKGCGTVPFSKVVAVPKSYKGYRIIAENDSTRQFYEQALRVRMWDAMCRNGVSHEINLRDQEVNATALAMYGEDVATIDLSSASDRVNWSLVVETFPSDVVRVMSTLRSWYVNVEGKMYPAYMAFTSGSALCFITESLIFWALTQCVRELCSTFLENDPKEYITLVYGDDIIVSTCLYDTCVELLSMINASVNLDKSYNSGHFRESCGADWLVINEGDTTRVEYVTSYYWPRKAIIPKLESAAPLLELNSRLFKYRSVHFFLRGLITSLCKGKMTFTQERTAPDVVTDCLDLYEDTYRRCKPHYTRDAINSGTLPEIIHLGKARIAELVSSKSTISMDDPDVQMYYYTQYLMHGPLYEDALMETLGVSSPRRSTKGMSNGISFDIRVDPVF